MTGHEAQPKVSSPKETLETSLRTIDDFLFLGTKLRIVESWFEFSKILIGQDRPGERVGHPELFPGAHSHGGAHGAPLGVKKFFPIITKEKKTKI